METSEFERLTAWKEGYTQSIIVFVLVTAVQIGLLVGALNLNIFSDIKKNFEKYRCNPLFMPFVGNFGYNPIDNFNFCVQGIFNFKAAEVFAPIYSILETFQGVLATVVNSAMSIRGMFANFLGGVEQFIASVRNKIQFLMNNVRMSFVRILNLMGKVYGSMFAVLFMGQSAMTASFNLANNDLVKFLFEFCFAPDTLVKMADGTNKAIKDVVIGDVLAEVPNNKSPVVTSVFRFAGASTPMVRIGDVVVSGAHYVLAGSAGMVPAEAHPDAVWAGSVPELVCLNVSGHRFRVGADGLLVADYDEHDSAAVVGETQRMAARALNGGCSGSGGDEEPVMDYSLGIGGSTEVSMADGSWKRMDEITIDDEVKYSGKVLGVVSEQCDTTVVSPSGIVFSGAQLVYDSSVNQWKRTANHWAGGAAGGAKTLYTIFTKNSGVISIRNGTAVEFIRDYREAPLPEMESAYEKEFLVAH
jgi:hypothetical protein